MSFEPSFLVCSRLDLDRTPRGSADVVCSRRPATWDTVPRRCTNTSSTPTRTVFPEAMADVKENELPLPLLCRKRVHVKPSNFNLAASLRPFSRMHTTGRRDQVLIVATRSDSHAD